MSEYKQLQDALDNLIYEILMREQLYTKSSRVFLDIIKNKLPSQTLMMDIKNDEDSHEKILNDSGMIYMKRVLEPIKSKNELNKRTINFFEHKVK